ncbi:MAG: translocation/assembly module TamB [Lunatimonas sp.]|uniref:translocation/assembly module TamB domain-containing protein n=1 Tax=Lunatimonas sp. TaxID=2060141 RepID=UPI00263B0586|nr:translocation/assembly module TamB domain-containing protein [Lunatimonas sp.]MCC5935652.1 translocation/assembly module TamB [Lunatimonas sp.]
MTGVRRFFSKVLKILAWLVGVLLLLVIALLLFLRSPWGQDIVVQKVVAYASEKTNTRISVQRLFLTFRGDVYLEGLYIEDQQGDTLVYSKSLETGLKIRPLLSTGAIHVSRLNWEGLHAQVVRDEQGVFNFDFLLEAFSSSFGSPATQQETAIISDAEASPFPDLALGPVRLSDFVVGYHDAILGTEVDLILGAFRLDVNSVDLNNMEFDIGDLVLADSDIRYLQRFPFPPSEDSEDGTSDPALILDNLTLDNIALSYTSLPDEVVANVVLGTLNLSIPEVDTRSRQLVVKQFLLHNSQVDLGLLAEPVDRDSSTTAGSEGPFEWPAWQVEVGTIDLEGNRMAFRTSDISPPVGNFDPNHVVADRLAFKADGISLANEKLKANITQFSFEERSGFVLKNFTIQAAVGNEETRIRSFQLETGNSQFVADVDVQYRDLDALIDGLVWEQVSLDVSTLRVGLTDAFYFSPEWRSNDLFKRANKKEIYGGMRITGTPNRLRAETALSWGGGTRFRVAGILGNVLDPDNLTFDLSPVSFRTTRTDINLLLGETQPNIKIPEEITFQTSLRGSLDELSAEASLKTPDGNVELTAYFKDGDIPSYEGDVFLDGIDLGAILDNPQFGSLGYRLQLTGKGMELDQLELTVGSEFEVLEVGGYDYQGLQLNAKIAQKQGNLSLAFKDENLDVALSVEGLLDEEHSVVDLLLDIKGADLRALELVQDDMRARLNYSIHWEGNVDEFSLATELKEGILVFNEQSYPIEGFDLLAWVDPDTTFVQLESSLLQVDFASNASPNRTMDAMTGYFDRVFADSIGIGVPDSTINLRFKMEVGRSRILEEVLLPGLENWESLSAEVAFDQQTGDFNGFLLLPGFTYSGIEIDSLGLVAEGKEAYFTFQAGLVALRSGALEIGRTFFDGEWQDEQLNLDFIAYDGEDKLVHVGWDMRFDGDTIGLHINPEDLILNKRQWDILPENSIRYGGGSIAIQQFELTRDNQRLELSNSLEDISTEHVGILFKDFRLSTFTSLLNPDELIATGFVNGSFVLENPFGATGILAALRIDELSVFSTPLGNLDLQAKSIDEGAYDFEMSLKGGGIDLDLLGDYEAAAEGAALNLELSLAELRLSVIQSLFPDQISGAEGMIVGKATVSGTTSDPMYDGEFGFRDAALTITTLNAGYRINNQYLKIDNGGVYLDEFTIRDTNDNTFVLGGSILTESLANPAFDLRLTAENFQVLNSSRADNDLFFGKAIIDASADIGGDLSLPTINARLNVRSGTDVTFIIPESQLDVIERDGVVLFVNRQDPDDILTRRQTEASTTGIKGFQVAAILEADPDAAFRIIVDERSGDNLLVAGKANLNLNVDPNGRINLSGTYELSSGHYEMSLYNLVSRRFEIEEGSSISWSGDPLDASLNMVAIYRVRTSAAELMAAQTAGLGADARSQYKQELPFLVFLNIDGDLTRLEPSFRLDMPEEQRGAAGGNVYGQLQLLNNQEGELNRQVFSLLVLNRFFPDRGGDGTGGGTSGLARSSVSQLLSGQLNTLSENVLGDTGLELDFDLDSFTDYQSGAAQDRTQLNVSARSRFMDDRLIVQVGSQIDIEGSSQAMDRGNALLGNVSIEYLLTENGRYRLRGFRRNQFESFIDGQLIVTGISVIFNREFNQFEELWKGIESQRRVQSEAVRKEEDEEATGNSN